MMMMHALCCLWSLGSGISEITSWAEQWWRKVHVELMSQGLLSVGQWNGWHVYSEEKDTLVMTWYHYLMRRIWRKGFGRAGCPELFDDEKDVQPSELFHTFYWRVPYVSSSVKRSDVGFVAPFLTSFVSRH
jgi:hypothetical protein